MLIFGAIFKCFVYFNKEFVLNYAWNWKILPVVFGEFISTTRTYQWWKWFKKTIKDDDSTCMSYNNQSLVDLASIGKSGFCC